MSARDAESGSSTYKGGSGSAGGLGNGGVGGGMGGGGNYGGGGGGGAGRNGGINSRTGLTTGNRMYGGTAFGRPGGKAFNPGAWGVRPSPLISKGPLSGVPRRPGVPVAPLPSQPPVPTAETIQGWLPGWQGTGMWWGDQPHYMNNSGLNPKLTSPHWGTWMDNSTAYGLGYDARTSPKAINDRVPIDPNFGGNTFDNSTGHVGYAGGYGRGWGGWNSPFR